MADFLFCCDCLLLSVAGAVTGRCYKHPHRPVLYVCYFSFLTMDAFPFKQPPISMHMVLVR